MSDVEKNIGTHKPQFAGEWVKLGDLLTEYKELNVGNRYRPVAVGRFGIRAREDIYTKELAKDYSKNKVIHQNTLTVGMGSKQIDIGILTSEERYSVSPAYHTYHIGDVDCDYLRYCLEARNADMFKRFAKRGTRQGKTIDLKRWLGYRIYLPSKERQAAVVRRLDAVERQIGDCKAMGQRLDDLVKSRFVEMFGDERNYTKLGDQCSKITKGTTPTTVGFQFQNEGVNFIKIESIGDNGQILLGKMAHIGESCHAALLRSRLEAGDLLFSIAGAIGRTAIVPDAVLPANTNQALAIIRLRSDAPLDKTYLRFALSSDAIRIASAKTKRGIAQINLSLKDVSDFRVPLPPLALQQQFADFVARVDKLGFDVQQQIEKLETLKQSLMQEYFG